ncbi:hypothetical protein ACFQAT_14130 [Undibacterium arcticum]|uniref:Uncharacterized protein n=1 Tax=Undibacterium arcticum TaxID=1762892 RepID=A0ABV7F8C5_9BURK
MDIDYQRLAAALEIETLKRKPTSTLMHAGTDGRSGIERWGMNGISASSHDS